MGSGEAPVASPLRSGGRGKFDHPRRGLALGWLAERLGVVRPAREIGAVAMVSPQPEIEKQLENHPSDMSWGEKGKNLNDDEIADDDRAAAGRLSAWRRDNMRKEHKWQSFAGVCADSKESHGRRRHERRCRELTPERRVFLSLKGFRGDRSEID